jgi:hypothetical protein
MERGHLRVEPPQESETPPRPEAPCGLAAPCSLPGPFLEFLGVTRSVDVSGTPDRLHHKARAFAAAAPRGRRHPLRADHESLPALDRRRLPLFLAALPLLRSDAAPLLVEVDPPAVLRKIGLPHAGLAGTLPAAVDGRIRVLQGLAEGALGFPVDAARREYAIASLPALSALLACAMAAWVTARGAARPAGAETWIPVP